MNTIATEAQNTKLIRSPVLISSLTFPPDHLSQAPSLDVVDSEVLVFSPDVPLELLKVILFLDALAKGLEYGS